MEILEITTTEIICDFNNKEHRINKAAFEQWADDNEKRHWEDNSSDHNGNHVQVMGIKTWEQYYDWDFLRDDLKEFLTVRCPENGKLRDMPDLGKSLSKLLKTI